MATPRRPRRGYGQPLAPNGYGQPLAPNGYGQPLAPNGYGQPLAPNGYAQPLAPQGHGWPPPAPVANGFGAVPSYHPPPAPAFGVGGQVGAPRAESAAGWSHRARMLAGWLTLFVIGTDLFVMSPLLPVVAERYRIDLTTAGWTVTSFSIGYMIAAPWLGGLSDKYGRRRVMVAGLVAFGVANLLTSVVSALTDSYGALVASRVAAGFSAAAITPSVYAATGDMAPPQRRATWLAIVGSGLLLAFGIGAPLGGFLAAALGVQALFLGIALACAVLAVLNLRAWPAGAVAPPQPPPGMAPAAVSRPLGPLTLIGAVGPTVLWSTALFGAYFYLGGGLAAAAGVTAAELAVILLFYGLGTVGGNLTGGRAADKFGPESVMIAAYLGLGLCWVVLATLLRTNAHDQAPIPLVGAGLALAAYVAQVFFPAQQARLARAHAARRGTVLAWNNSALYFGMCIGSTLGGAIVRGAGFPALLNVLSVLAFVSALLFSGVTWAKQVQPSPA